MKILVLSQYFTPEPITKPLEIAEALRDAGHTVHVVTGFPNYPDGKLYPGFPLRLFRRDVVAGIPVIRTWVFPSHGSSRLGRLLNYASFMVSSVAGGVVAGRFDAMYVWHPPLSIGVAAAAIAAIRRRQFVYDVLDIWPESAVATGFLRPGRVFDLLTRVETFVYRRAAHLFVVTDGAKANLVAKGVPLDKITVAPPWYDEADMRRVVAPDRDAIRAQRDWHGRFVVMFAGNMGVLQGLDNVLHAAKRLPGDTRILIAMVGDGMDLPRLKQLATELDVTDRVTFVERQPASAMARYFAAADALFVQLRTSPVADFSIPAKTIAYLAAGKPIVVASTGTAADVVLAAEAGIALPPDDPDRLAQAFVQVSRMHAEERARMGRRGRQYFDTHFRKEAILPAYIDALSRVGGKRHR
jgi:glycosyltransferase involved in cell wall biosynthesis